MNRGMPPSPVRGKDRGGLYVAVSFTYWQFLYSGDPSVSFADSSPKRGAKGCGAANAPVPNLSRGALPLLGEVPSAHTGERGSQRGDWSRVQKTVQRKDQIFPLRSFMGSSATTRVTSQPYEA